MALDYKSLGKGWAMLETYNVHDYAEPGYTNPNSKSLAMWEGGSVNGFVLYAVSLFLC